MKTILVNYTDLIAKNWVVPAINASATSIETETATETNYDSDCASKSYCLSSHYNNDKYVIDIVVFDKTHANNACFTNIRVIKYSLDALLKGNLTNNQISNHVIELRSESDLLQASQKLESLLPTKTQ
ncbi:hypothetical protein EB001_11805, partial [bacterium]|nr:hypothetical protein [bacterium]